MSLLNCTSCSGLCVQCAVLWRIVLCSATVFPYHSSLCLYRLHHDESPFHADSRARSMSDGWARDCRRNVFGIVCHTRNSSRFSVFPRRHDMTLCYIRVRFLLRSLLSVSSDRLVWSNKRDRLLRCSCLCAFGGVRGKCPFDCEYSMMSKGTLCKVWWSVHYESSLQLAEIRKAVMSVFLCSVALHWFHCLHEFCLMCVILGIGAYLVLVILDRVNISDCVLWRVFCRWIRIVSGKFNFGRCAGTIRDDRFLQSKL